MYRLCTASNMEYYIVLETCSLLRMLFVNKLLCDLALKFFEVSMYRVWPNMHRVVC